MAVRVDAEGGNEELNNLHINGIVFLYWQAMLTESAEFLMFSNNASYRLRKEGRMNKIAISIVMSSAMPLAKNGVDLRDSLWEDLNEIRFSGRPRGLLPVLLNLTVAFWNTYIHM